MKKIFLIISIILIARCTFAQKIGLGIEGGINMASINPVAPQSLGASSQSRATFRFGLTLDYKLTGFNIQPGLFLSGKGNTSTTVQNFISNGSPVPYYQTNSTNVTYIELPVNVLYKHIVKPGTLYVGAGPYVAYAVYGSYTTKATMNDYYKQANSTSIGFGNGDDQLKSVDYGVNILANIVLNNGLKLGLNYGLGLNNISNAGTTSQNRVFSVLIGYTIK